MEQLILHLFGDYVTQSDWMAQNKTKSTWAAFCHATIYSLPFLLIGSRWTFLVIWGTHLLIDRFRLARYVAWAKNVVLSPYSYKWEYVLETDAELYTKSREDLAQCRRLHWDNCSGTGYPSDAPPFLAVWLLIACDNTLHLAINWLALRWL